MVLSRAFTTSFEVFSLTDWTPFSWAAYCEKFSVFRASSSRKKWYISIIIKRGLRALLAHCVSHFWSSFFTHTVVDFGRFFLCCLENVNDRGVISCDLRVAQKFFRSIFWEKSGKHGILEWIFFEVHLFWRPSCRLWNLASLVRQLPNSGWLSLTSEMTFFYPFSFS